MATREWCQQENTQTERWGTKGKSIRVRCPKCKKRFMTVWYECGDPGCWHEYLPAHKVTVKPHKKGSRDHA